MIGANDRLAILDLVARADAFATARDADGYAALFTDDAVMTGAKGEHRGVAAIRDAVRAVWAGERAGTRHLTAAPIIDEDNDFDVTVRSTLMLVIADPIELVGLAAIAQAVRLTPKGWRIASRTIA